MTPSLNIMFPYHESDTCSGIAAALVEAVRAAIAAASVKAFFARRADLEGVIGDCPGLPSRELHGRYQIEGT